MSLNRFSQVSRRAFLGGASIAAVSGLAACGNNSSSSSPTTTAASSAAASASAAPATSATTAATTAAAASGTFAASAKATITFTYTTSGGMAKNPYYAVWVEDAKGTFVKTLLLDHLNGQDRWLNEMTAWMQASGGTDTTTQGTQPAGTYSVTWDGTDVNGKKLATGQYTICIEANREHGSESLVQKVVTLGSSAVSTDLGTNGEITAASLKYTA